MRKKLDLVGQRFGRLLVIEEAGRDKHRGVLWRCKCDCGNEVTVRSNALRTHHTTSCGCYCRECSTKRSTTHGMHKTRLYRIWVSMLTRSGVYKCSNEETKHLYQDRGISVCAEWLVFENFLDWSLANGYEDTLEIDRIDNDKGYFHENCRWITPKENSNNRRNTLRLPDGRSLAMFCTEIGIPTVQENGRMSKQYARIQQAYHKRHKIHPELLTRANEYLNTLRKLKASLDLLKDVREFRKCNASQMISLPET